MLPRSAYEAIVATVADYERMKKTLNVAELSKEQYFELTKRVNAIENAICAVCEGEPYAAGQALLRDIANHRGFERSEAKKYYPVLTTYERRKRDAIRTIGKMLGIIV